MPHLAGGTFTPSGLRGFEARKRFWQLRRSQPRLERRLSPGAEPLPGLQPPGDPTLNTSSNTVRGKLKS